MSCRVLLIRTLCENMESGFLCNGGLIRKHEGIVAAQCLSRLGNVQRDVCCAPRCPTSQYTLRALKGGERAEFEGKHYAKVPCLRSYSTLAASVESYHETSSCCAEETAVNNGKGATKEKKTLNLVVERRSAVLVTEEGKGKSTSRKRSRSIVVPSRKASSQCVSTELESKVEITAEGVIEEALSGRAESCGTINEPNVTIIVFDIETTGFRASDDRIIEFAARDLAGGDHSTVSALVNPGRHVPYFISAITGITNAMVNRPEIPSWREVGPVIVRFVESRRQGDGPVILVAHNGKRFDVPFLLKEFQDCSIEIPKSWLFLDSMPLARETKKKCGYEWPSLKLVDIHKCYGLPKTGRAHRAMADVHMLAPILGMMVSDLKMSLSEILQRSFTAEDIMSNCKLFQAQGDKDLTASEDLMSEEILAKEEGFEAPWEGPEDNQSIDAVEDSEQTNLEIFSDELNVDLELPSFGASVDTSSVDATQLDPVLKEYVRLKREMPNFVHLLKSGDYYEAFFEDAETLARACKYRLTATDDGKMEVPTVRVSIGKSRQVVELLLSKGLSVVKQNQFEGGGIDAVLTPGMLLDSDVCEDTRNNYLAAVMATPGTEVWGLAFCDVSTGELFATQGKSRSSLIQEISHVEPAELLVPSEATAIHLPFTRTAMRALSNLEFYPLTNESDLLQYTGCEVADELRNRGAADCAAGALLRYIQRTQGSVLEGLPFRKLRLYSADHFLPLDQSVKSYLGLLRTPGGALEGSLLWAMDDTKTSMGSRMLKRWIQQPLLSVQKISIRQDAVQVLSRNAKLRSGVRYYLSNCMDVGRLAGVISRKSPVAWEDILALAESLSVLPKLCCILDKLPDNQYFSAVTKTPAGVLELAEEIQGMLATDSEKGPAGELVRDGVDETLDALRAEARDCRRFLEDFMKAQSEVSKPTRRKKNDTRELLEYERKKDEALSRSSEREQELLDLSKQKITAALNALQETSESLAALDVLCSFAETAVTRNYCRPEVLQDGQELTVVSGRHPVLEVVGEFVANSCFLGHDEERRPPLRPNLLILTGLNGSGKSSYLQQIGLIQLLAQCGSFIPAKEARLSITDSIYVVNHDSAAEVLKKASKGSLVLLDEFRVSGDSHEAQGAVTSAAIEFLAEEVRARTIYCRDHFLRFLAETPLVAHYYISSCSHNITPAFVGLDNGTKAELAGEYPQWVRSRASELLNNVETTSRLVKEDSTILKTSAGAPSLWHRIMSFTKGNTENQQSHVSLADEATSNEELSVLWGQVSTMLQGTPATMALAQQKGSLLSISKSSQLTVVTIGTDPLFVKKFKQHEHATALEVAFARLLNRPVKLRVQNR